MNTVDLKQVQIELQKQKEKECRDLLKEKIKDRLHQLNLTKLAKITDKNTIVCKICKFECKDEVNFNVHLKAPQHQQALNEIKLKLKEKEKIKQAIEEQKKAEKEIESQQFGVKRKQPLPVLPEFQEVEEENSEDEEELYQKMKEKFSEAVEKEQNQYKEFIQLNLQIMQKEKNKEKYEQPEQMIPEESKNEFADIQVNPNQIQQIYQEIDKEDKEEIKETKQFLESIKTKRTLEQKKLSQNKHEMINQYEQQIEDEDFDIFRINWRKK